MERSICLDSHRTLVKERQAEYYEALGKADRDADSTVFIEFMLIIIRDVLSEMTTQEN